MDEWEKIQYLKNRQKILTTEIIKFVFKGKNVRYQIATISPKATSHIGNRKRLYSLSSPRLLIFLWAPLAVITLLFWIDALRASLKFDFLFVNSSNSQLDSPDWPLVLAPLLVIVIMILLAVLGWWRTIEFVYDERFLVRSSKLLSLGIIFVFSYMCFIVLLGWGEVNIVQFLSAFSTKSYLIVATIYAIFVFPSVIIACISVVLFFIYLIDLLVLNKNNADMAYKLVEKNIGGQPLFEMSKIELEILITWSKTERDVIEKTLIPTGIGLAAVAIVIDTIGNIIPFQEFVAGFTENYIETLVTTSSLLTILLFIPILLPSAIIGLAIELIWANFESLIAHNLLIYACDICLAYKKLEDLASISSETEFLTQRPNNFWQYLSNKLSVWRK